MIKSECICLDMMEGLWGTPGSSFSLQIILQQGAVIWIDQDKEVSSGFKLSRWHISRMYEITTHECGSFSSGPEPLKHGAFLLK